MTDEEQRRVFSRNLNTLLSMRQKSQKEVADAIGVSTQTFNTWCQGIAIPRMWKLQALADYFDVPLTDLTDDKGYLIGKKSCKGISVPVYGRVAAGIPIEMIEDIIDTEEIPEEMAKGGEYFGLKIHGDSMEPKISDGDVVIIRKQDDAETGDTVIVAVNGTDATCKKIKKYHDGIELVSTNPSYEPMFYSNDEIREKPVTILGKVVELRAKL